jgi:molybdate transport system ATP-binding protein
MNTIDVKLAGKAGTTEIDADFTTDAQILGISGPSGAGKTSLLHMIAGVAKPLSGHIKISGFTMFDSKAGICLNPNARSIGFVFQDSRLFPHMSVVSNLTYATRARREPPSHSFDEVINVLDIKHLLLRAPKHLSGGEKQRVAIGRALLANPKLLIMDEPLTSVDAVRRQTILEFLLHVAKTKQIPMIYVSHDAQELSQMADSLVHVAGGTARNLKLQ